MTRTRVAIVLGVVAVLAVLGTAAVAISRHDDEPGRVPDNIDVAGTLTVRDPASGATFEVAAGRWRVEDRSVRIYYTDERDRPVAVVRGPAVFRAGYCTERPKDSNRAFTGFTRQGFGAWVRGVSGVDGFASTGADQVTLADGSPARLTRVEVAVEGGGPCAAREVEVAMIEAGDVRVVLVRDSGEDGTLPADEVAAILTSLRP